MKRYSEKKLYNTTIIKLKNTRFFKGDTAYRFLFYSYEKGLYTFAFCKESDFIKYNGNANIIYHVDGLKGIINRLWNQHTNDYKETYSQNCTLFDRCELINDLQEVCA